MFELDSHLWTWLHRIRGFWRIPALVTRGGRVVRLFDQCGLRLVAAGKSSLWSGPFAHTVMRGLEGPIRLNGRLADVLPFFMSSGMYFCFERRSLETR